ncbi:phycobiliprotein lyase [Leptothoe sp. PORK10 BA2]|uniref:phycobiliprotein lyase n=1 Tax=Leptothoe sp. PORK10 BA2 TaxID=3110254 RepID=UPI002B21FCCD|nr:phycobiliprotein lyase [Leptothoe sp. PORK10 BA2]MEA5465420.1 phycobiliprotein lyase [Leptothoe sp. PORK10 BA2]
MSFQSPMTMMDFFRKSEGIWFIQRAVHHFDSVTDESGESNLIVDVIEAQDPRIVEICQSQGVDPSKAAGGAQFSWQSNTKEFTYNSDYAAILVDVPNADQGLTGQLLRDRGYVENRPVVGRYGFADDGVLTIDNEYDKNQGQERCWFLSEDFRVRVSSARLANGINLIAYCSERRFVTQDDLAKMVTANTAKLRAE